jgi:glycosyltransferase involved in cell wall biosynthesis
MRLHLLALPHTQVTADYASCAYTQKIRKFCRMMGDRGHDVVLYAGEHCDIDVAEHVMLVTEAERTRWFGDGFDTVLTPLSWEPSEPYWLTMNSRAIPAIAERADEKDLILLSTGTQRLVLDAFPFPSRIVAEPFVGYEGIVTGFCAFESQTFMHTVYAKRGIGDGRDFDAVIPNYFDPDDFPVLSTGGDYLLFVGRVIPRKGVGVAAEIAKQTGMRLLIAGPGVTEYKAGHHLRGPGLELLGDHFEYVGEVGIQERAELMAGAHALLAPTSFLEPFGGVAVESMMAGCPAITTDHGAFMETVPAEFRFRNMRQALKAVDEAGVADREWLRDYAHASYSLDAVAPRFEEWFARLLTLWGDGWYELPIADTNERITVCPS